MATRGGRRRRARFSRAFMEQSDIDRERGREAEDIAQERLTGFDAEEGAARAGRAQFETFREDLQRDLGDLRGSQVGRGRLRSGFGFDEEDELIEFGLRDLNRQLTQNALQAQGLNLSAARSLGQTGGQRTGRFLDILASERDADLLEEEMERREKARSRGGLLRGLGAIAGGAAGFFAGGPGAILPGAQAGASLAG